MKRFVWGLAGRGGEWRAIFYVQARIAILFVPIIVSLLIIGVLAGNDHDPGALDRTVTSSVK
ncbi:hypothetical protein [Mesorhizobium sp.]|uniref:hypothetical protein n=1 Tax=Mesorhizobium sp. TaxID=1871066 RepID=UPI000FE520D9|nr:hypothetical protein [Mesorhizobium sp.]RWM00613.1 MAG: hypothetical protein EOR71_30025 [Mesorhizobium sp.]TIO47983.1 MAG: hypothetical protein E5X78_30865 [Mesorhizobium sp.]TIO56398.1 MAG: hypothetical protein E5X79_30755 [Mesorhizobium sp.]TJV57641.1 MAG: hypothetical protein E5X80_29575 [Mesorhizobium sp.]